MAKKYRADKTAVSFKYSHLLIQRTELIAGAILTLITIFLHLTFMLHAGAFWRDEVNSIALATMPSISDTWHCLSYDSFPILLSLILRLWTALVSDNELGLRIFGFLVSISILGVFWLNGRFLGYRVPLLSIALFAISPLAIRTADAIRPYGVGILLILLTFGLIWKVVQDGRTWQIAAAAIAAILSVQCLYQNAFFLAAIIFAGIIAAVCYRRWKKIILLVSIGIIAAISLLPYLQSIKNAQDWVILFKHPVSFLMIYREFFSALTAGGRFGFAIWIGFTLSGICILPYSYRPQTDHNQNRSALFLFCMVAMIVCTAAQLLFLKSMQVYVRSWYFLPSMAVTAIFLDVVFSSFNLWNILRIVLAIIAVVTTFNISQQEACIRQTNIDIIASELEQSAGKDDLIVVNPWYLSISFQHYYHGLAPFTTLPPIEDYKVHRYDLIKAKIASADPIEPVLSETSRILKSGGSVWIVGGMRGVPPPENYLPQPLPPAPNSIYGWSANEYTISWEQQFMHLILSHIAQDSVLPPLTDKPISSLENCSIGIFRGWRQQ